MVVKRQPKLELTIKLTEEQVVEMLRKKQEEAGLSLRKFALSLGITAPYLSEIYRGTRHPGEAVLNFLDLEKHVITHTYYTQRGIRP